jgi:hypothetical protein
MRSKIRKFFTVRQDAIGVVEIILILVIIIGLVLIFRDQISGIIEDAFEAITGDATDIIEN